MTVSRDEFGEARLLWKRAAGALPRGGRPPCPGANELAAYLDGAARGVERDGIEEHLRLCPACAGAVAELRALLRAGPSPAPAEVFERAKGLVAERPAGEEENGAGGALLRFFSAMRISAAWAAAAAAVVAACVAGFMMGEETSAQRAAESARLLNGDQDPILAEFSRLEETYIRGDLT